MTDDEMMCHSDTCGRSLNDGGCPEDDPNCHYCDRCDAHYWCENPRPPCDLCDQDSCDRTEDPEDECSYKFEGEEK